MDFARIVRHLALPDLAVRRAFPVGASATVEKAVASAEKAHDVELRVVVEGGLPLGLLLRGVGSRERAIELFSQLRVWDTRNNTGMLIYLQFADRQIEIVADRGISARIGQQEWDAACAAISAEFAAGRFQQGVLAGIERIATLLGKHVPPPPPDDRDELPDRPAML
jgi:uncharacterized membrane protein